VVAADARDRVAGAAELMALLADPEFWIRLVGIGVLNLLLSGDNALVIALAVRALPKRKRLQGQVWGAVGAVVLRLIFVAIVQALLQIPLLQLVGGFLLVWIAVRLVRPEAGGDSQVRRGSSLWEAVWIIIVADVTMSLDNVLAIAATAHGDFLLVMFGIGLSLPIVIWGAGLLAILMNRFTWIVWLGGGLLGFVAGEMLIDDPVVQRWLGDTTSMLHYAVPVGLGAAITAIGWWLGRGHRHAHVPENL
jgi:YjbE family integral membrane protein